MTVDNKLIDEIMENVNVLNKEELKIIVQKISDRMQLLNRREQLAKQLWPEKTK